MEKNLNSPPLSLGNLEDEYLKTSAVKTKTVCVDTHQKWKNMSLSVLAEHGHSGCVCV